MCITTNTNKNFQPSRKNKKVRNTQKKNPNAPKRFRSNFILFSQSKTAQYKKRLGPNVPLADISKHVSREWGSLDEEARRPWDQAAIKDRLRYEYEMRNFQGPLTVPNVRAKKNPEAPKRNMSAFLNYARTARAGLKKTHPYISFSEASKILSEQWKNMSPQERQPHLEWERQARANYKRRMTEWKARKQVNSKISDRSFNIVNGTSKKLANIHTRTEEPRQRVVFGEIGNNLNFDRFENRWSKQQQPPIITSETIRINIGNFHNRPVFKTSDPLPQHTPIIVDKRRRFNHDSGSFTGDTSCENGGNTPPLHVLSGSFSFLSCNEEEKENTPPTTSLPPHRFGFASAPITPTVVKVEEEREDTNFSFRSDDLSDARVIEPLEFNPSSTSSPIDDDAFARFVVQCNFDM